MNFNASLSVCLSVCGHPTHPPAHPLSLSFPFSLHSSPILSVVILSSAAFIPGATSLSLPLMYLSVCPSLPLSVTPFLLRVTVFSLSLLLSLSLSLYLPLSLLSAKATQHQSLIPAFFPGGRIGGR